MPTKEKSSIFCKHQLSNLQVGLRPCPKHSITEVELDRQIAEKLKSVQLIPDFVDWALETLAEEERMQPSISATISEAQKTTRSSLTKRIDALYRMREDEEISREEFLKRKAKHELALKELDEEVGQVATKVSLSRESLRQMLIFGRDAYPQFRAGTLEEKRLITQSFGSYVLTLGKVHIQGSSLFDRMRVFEPIKIGSPSEKDGPSGAVHLVWRAILDEIRTAVTDRGDTST